ncbi:MAG: hypothetical protein AAGG47_17875 [Pseudomonadota bacterium]
MLLILDVKGELAAISQNQTADRKHARYWNPVAMHGLSQDSINPVEALHIGSPSLHSDVKVFLGQFLPNSGAAQSLYFEQGARRMAEGLVHTLVKTNGVLTLPDFYKAVQLIETGGQAWLDFAW